MNNIYNNPITVWGETLVLGNVFPHHEVAAGVESDGAAAGALHLDMAHVQVGGENEGAGRKYLEQVISKNMLLDANPPSANEGNFGVWLSHQQTLWASPTHHIWPGKSSF